MNKGIISIASFFKLKINVHLYFEYIHKFNKFSLNWALYSGCDAVHKHTIWCVDIGSTIIPKQPITEFYVPISPSIFKAGYFCKVVETLRSFL